MILWPVCKSERYRVTSFGDTVYIYLSIRVSAYPCRVLDYAYTRGHADGEYRILSRLHFTISSSYISNASIYINIYTYIFAIKPCVRFSLLSRARVEEFISARRKKEVQRNWNYRNTIGRAEGEGKFDKRESPLNI